MRKTAAPRAKKLGRNIARLRSQAFLTQERLAEKAGISTRYLQDLEMGLYTPTIFVVDGLRTTLGVSWEIFLDGC